MDGYTKHYIEGTVLSFDGRVYTFLLPQEETIVLKYDTVHGYCTFPKHLMQDDHLKIGSTIKMCVIDKGEKRSVLPDHRFYLYSKFRKLSDGTIVRVKNASALKETAKCIRQCAQMFEEGLTEESILLLKSLISYLDKGTML